MMCNNPKLDFVNMNAFIKSSVNLSICSQDIERKLKSAITLVLMSEK